MLHKPVEDSCSQAGACLVLPELKSLGHLGQPCAVGVHCHHTSGMGTSQWKSDADRTEAPYPAITVQVARILASIQNRGYAYQGCCLTHCDSGSLSIPSAGSSISYIGNN